MSTELAVISDTHVPAREEAIPEPFRERIAAADHAIHAGDFETSAVLSELCELSADLTAVHGNADPAGIGLPAVADLSVEGITFVVTHGTLNPVEAAVYSHDGMVLREEDWANAIADTTRARARAWDDESVIGIGGHTHRIEDRVHEGVRLLNPGSATGAEPADEATMLTVVVDDGAVDVTLHRA
ncbi:MAG: metallophosphoesterase family protein [Haloferacaceae archaeon]